MALILTDNITVGIAPIATPPGPASPIPPTAAFEFRPVPTTLSIEDGGGPGANYISTYQPFSLVMTAIPTAAAEVISSTTITLTHCVLEDPLPGTDTTKSLNAPLKIPVSPFWAPGLFLEPLVICTPGINTSTISGYFTERNWFDRVVTVSYLNAVAKFNSNGMFYLPFDKLPPNLPIDLKNINIPFGSGVNINTFYPLSIGAAYTTESELLEGYLSFIGQVISYKGTDIKKLRFYFNILVTSNYGTFPFTAYMIVQYNQKAANKRLQFLLKRRNLTAILKF